MAYISDVDQVRRYYNDTVSQHVPQRSSWSSRRHLLLDIKLHEPKGLFDAQSEYIQKIHV